MPTFTAISLDTLIEPGAAKSMAPPRNSPYPRFDRSRTVPNSRQDSISRLERGASVPLSVKNERGVSVSFNVKLERGVSISSNVKLERGVNIPPIPKPDRRNGASVVENKYHWTQISPALYAIPESTPLPDSPSSFPPSPYIINHKRRGPRLAKSSSENDIVICERPVDEITVDGAGNAVEKDPVISVKDDFAPREVVDSTMDKSVISATTGDAKEKHLNDVENEGIGSSGIANGSAGEMENGVLKSVAFDLQQDSEVDDPQDSVSVKSIDESECNVGLGRSLNSTTPVAEFYDAWEELSSENGSQLPMPDIENELREVRLSLLMEIERRKQAEEALNNMRNKWQRICEQLSLVGLTLPVDPTVLPECNQPMDPATDVLQQVFLVRLVSNSIGRGIGKAEVEMEMEARLKLKNTEIARLLDKLHYYEAVNQEMSQRNQEVVETARRTRQRRKRRQRWVWRSVATVITLGSAAFAYSFFKSGKGSSSSSQSHGPEVDQDSN